MKTMRSDMVEKANYKEVVFFIAAGFQPILEQVIFLWLSS